MILSGCLTVSRIDLRNIAVEIFEDRRKFPESAGIHHAFFIQILFQNLCLVFIQTFSEDLFLLCRI